MHELSDTAMQIGRVVAGKYRIDRILGAGGMGVVVAATHLQLDQQIALKFIRSEVMSNPEVVGRFEREARAAVRLKSEHAARIIDVGRLDSGAPYIVMEYLEGQDLSALLAQRGSFGVSQACDLIIQACDAIAEAHSLGIVHRDLKPGNLFLARTSHGQQIVKVLDFGISKTGAALDPSMTRTQTVMGSPGYMSPEQMRSTRNVDGRSDVWSLGVILYELVAGHVPFQADSFTALCLKVAMDPLPPLPALPVTLPAGFEAVVRRALEKDPAARFASAIELAHALAPFAGPLGRERAYRLITSPVAVQSSAAHHVLAASAETTLGAAAGESRSDVVGRRRRRARWMVVGIGIGAVAAIGVAIGVARPPAQPVMSAGSQLQVEAEITAAGSPIPVPAARDAAVNEQDAPAITVDAGVELDAAVIADDVPAIAADAGVEPDARPDGSSEPPGRKPRHKPRKVDPFESPY